MKPQPPVNLDMDQTAYLRPGPAASSIPGASPIQPTMPSRRDLPFVAETKEVHLVKVNSDLTEGRGQTVILAICDQESTAVRLGKGQNVQGTDANIEKSLAVQFIGDPYWYAPCLNIVKPTSEDKKLQDSIDLKKATLEKIRALGLSSAELAAINLKL